jgi:hypothetical protein
LRTQLEDKLEKPGSNPALQPGRMAIQSAYTEAEAIEDLIAAAREIEKPGFCDDFECDCCTEANGAAGSVIEALQIYDTYKGVK